MEETVKLNLMKIPKHITYLEIAFHLIAYTAFSIAIVYVFLVAFTDVLVLPKQEAIDYVLIDSLIQNILNK